MIISMDTWKAFDKLQHPIIITASKKLEIEENFLNCEKPTVNITLNGKSLHAENLKAFSQDQDLLLLLYSIVLEVLARAIRQEK